MDLTIEKTLTLSGSGEEENLEENELQDKNERLIVDFGGVYECVRFEARLE